MNKPVTLKQTMLSLNPCSSYLLEQSVDHKDRVAGFRGISGEKIFQHFMWLCPEISSVKPKMKVVKLA